MQKSIKRENYVWHEFGEQNQLVSELANVIQSEIKLSIEKNGRAIVAVSGGSTPKPLFIELAQRDIDWAKVIITLVDERWVSSEHPLSNAAFLDKHLLSALPSAVSFVSLYHDAVDCESSLQFVLEHYCEVTGSSIHSPAPFDVVILGMGNDGHTASFFPDAENIADLVDPNSAQFLHSCTSPTTQVPRVTWSLSQLLSTQKLILHIVGEAKNTVFQTALKDSDAIELPIRSVIFQELSSLQVYYAN